MGKAHLQDPAPETLTSGKVQDTLSLDTTSTPPSEAGPSGTGSGDLRVLVVEDNESDRWFFSEVLRSQGYAVTSCADGAAAWAAFEESAPPVVLLDLNLPDADGLELCRRFRATPEGSRTVILVITGRSDGTVLHDVLDAGADDFLAKPADPALLSVRLAIARKMAGEREARQRAVDALVSQKQMVEALFANLDDVFFSFDLGSRTLIQVSPATQRLLGYSPEEIAGSAELQERYLLGSLAPSDLEDLASAGVGTTVTREFSVARKDGTLRWIRASVKSVHPPEDSGSTRVDGILSDITEAVRAREQLARRNDELSALYAITEVTLKAHSLPDAYQGILDVVGEATGYPIVGIEHLDREHDSLVMTASRGIPSVGGTLATPLHRTPSGAAVQSGKPVVLTDRKRLKKELPDALSSLGIETYLALPLTMGTEVRGTLLLAHTEATAPGEQMMRWAASLAAAAAALIDRIEAEEALKESESRYRKLAAQLQQANQELESFAYSVSHDLRAPLRTMQGFAHALLQNFGDTLPPEAQDFARRIIASGQQSEVLIRDLLAYSRLSFESLELKPVDLGSAVDAAMERVRADLDASHAHVEVERPLPTVRGDHTTLVQVVSNLLANAVKFVPPDRKPEIRIRADEDDGPAVRLWVEDNGMGIPADQEERIFRVFERLTESGDRPGTGIGLAIVRRGMQRIGGTAGVRRNPDRGSAFWIEIPKERRHGWRPWSRRN